MTKLNQKSRSKIEPSTRDSISSWLDVLTSMLAVSESQRLQIRDELEDHLRSRVDDLLIVGKSEPDAIQIAVAELGETAELAKLITHAHTRINPRRKIMNAALIAVALGGMSFGGFTFFNGTAAPSATPNNGGAVPVVVPEEAKRDDKKTHAFDLVEVPDTQAVEAIAEAFGLEIQVSDGLKSFYQQKGFPYKFTLQGENTLDQAIKVLEWADVKKLYSRVVQYDDRALILMTGEEFIRQQIETRVYALPLWIGGTQASVTNYAKSLQSLLKVKYDLGYTSIQLISDSLVVAAPPEIHSEIFKLMDELENTLGQQRAERMREVEIENAKIKEANEKREADRQARLESQRAKIKSDREQLAAKRNAAQEQAKAESRKYAIELKAQRKQAIERVQAEFDRVRTEMILKESMMTELESRLGELKNIFDPKSRSGMQSTEIVELEKAFIDTKLLHEEYQSRYDYLRDTLIKSEYAELFEGLE